MVALSAHTPVHLVRKGAHGDVLLTTAVARALKARYPKAPVWVWTRCPDLIRSRYVDNVVHWTESWPPAPHGGAWIMLDDAYERRPIRHIVHAYAEVVGIPVPDTRPDLVIRPEEIRWAKQMTGGRDAVLFDIGRTWASRQYPVHHFAALADYVNRKGLKAVGIGEGFAAPSGILHIRSPRMIELVGLFGIARAFVGADSVWSHVAQGQGTPVVLIFGATDPDKRMHHGAPGTFIRNGGLPCIGCHHRRSAPRYFTECDGGAFMGARVAPQACMTFSPEPLLGALRKFIG